MEKIINDLRKEYSKILSLKDLNFIEKETKKDSKDETTCEEIFRENVQKFILGEFDNKDSKTFIYNYINSLINSNLKDLEIIKSLSKLFKTAMIFPEVDLVLNIINNNNNLYELLENIFLKYTNIILEDKAYLLVDDIFAQFMDAFLDLKGIKVNENDFDVSPLVETNPLRMYILQIADYPVLSKEEEIELFKRYEKGDKDARNKLIECNLRLVIKFSRRFLFNENYESNVMDIIQAGNIGLFNAIKGFDYRRGYKFSTYASWWIRQAFQRHIEHDYGVIRFPAHIHSKLTKLNAFYNEFQLLNGRTPTENEMVNATNLSAEQINTLLTIPRKLSSLNAPVTVEDEEFTLEDTLVDTEINYENEIALSLIKDNIYELFEQAGLTEKEKDIISLRMGLGGEEPKTLQEIGNIYFVSRERIRTIESKCLRQLRKCKNIKQYAVYMDNPDEACKFIDDLTKKKSSRKKY